MSIFQFDQFNQRSNQIPQQYEDKNQHNMISPQQRRNQHQIIQQANTHPHNLNNAYANPQINTQQVQPIIEQNPFQQHQSQEDNRSAQNNYPSPLPKEFLLNQISNSTPLGVATLGQNPIQYQQLYAGGSGNNQIGNQNEQQFVSNNNQNTLNPTGPLHTDREQTGQLDEGGIQAINYCTEQNGARIVQCTSYTNKCHPQNLLNSTRNSIWMSEEGLPQSVVVDLTNLQQKPRFFKCVGFDCWHDYSTNPAKIEISVSTDGINFVTWVTLRAELKAGIQLFSVDPLGKRYNFIKFTIKETHGASKVYMNCLYILEDNPMIKINKQSNLTQQSLIQQTEVISPTNKNMSISQNTVSKELLQLRTSPIQHIDIQTQSSPQNMTLLSQSNQQILQRRSPSNNQLSAQNQSMPLQNISGNHNKIPIENQNLSYQDEYHQQLLQLQQQKASAYQQDMVYQNLQQQHANHPYYQQQQNLNNQSKIQHNLSGVDDDYRLMSGSIINGSNVHNNQQIIPNDYQRQNILEDTRSIFLDPNNNSINQLYPTHQIVDNIMSFSAHKSNSKQLKNGHNNFSSNQQELEQYINPYEQQQNYNNLLQQHQQLKNSQSQLMYLKAQEARKQMSNSNQYQNTADFTIDNRPIMDMNDHNYRISSNPKSLKSSGQISPGPTSFNERQAWMQIEQKYKEEINILQKELVSAKHQISSLGLIVEKMQDTKNTLIEKIALIAESLSLFKEEVYERILNLEKDVAYANTIQQTQGEKLLREDLLISTNNGNKTPPQKIEPQRSTTSATLNTKQDILEKYLPRKNSSYHHQSVSPRNELVEQEKSISNIVNFALDKKLQDLEASLQRTLMQSFNKIQQTQADVGDKLTSIQSVRDLNRDTSHLNNQSQKSSFNYQKLNSPTSTNRQYQSTSIRESQMNGQQNQHNLNNPQFNSNGYSQYKSRKEGEQTYVNSVASDLNNQTPPLLTHSTLGMQGQDQKNTRVIQLLDKLQNKLAQRQNKVEELNKKEKKLKQRQQEQLKDNSNKENKDKLKLRKNKKESPKKQLFSETSDLLDY